MAFKSILKGFAKKLMKPFKYLIEDSRNMGRVSLGVTAACIPVAIFSPLAFVAIASIAVTLFIASVYFKGVKDKKHNDLYILTGKDQQAERLFKGVSLKKLSIQKSRLNELGLCIDAEGKDIKIENLVKLEVLGIKPKHIKLKTIKNEDASVAHFIHFRTNKGFNAVARVVDEEMGQDNENKTDENEKNKEILKALSALKKHTRVLEKKVAELENDRRLDSTNFVASPLSRTSDKQPEFPSWEPAADNPLLAFKNSRPKDPGLSVMRGSQQRH